MKKASYIVQYNGRNITTDISRHVLAFSYSDKSAGEADDFQITVEDTKDFWKKDWYPTKGDTIDSQIISDGKTLPCGKFTVDEITSDGGLGGDTITIKAIAAGIDIKARTKRSHAHEKKSLREIANTVAGNLGLSLSGEIPAITIDRITQRKETDLAFLNRIAKEYGFTFSVRDKTLFFTDMFKLEKGKAVLTVDRSMLTSWSLNDKTAGTFATVRVRHHDNKKKQTVEYEGRETNKAFTGKNDALELHVRAENKQQAEMKGRAALWAANSKTQSGSINMPGNILMLAGNNFNLTGLFSFDGLYFIESSTHNIDRGGGYVTDCQIKRVGYKETT
jgi:phage protein D